VHKGDDDDDDNNNNNNNRKHTITNTTIIKIKHENFYMLQDVRSVVPGTGIATVWYRFFQTEYRDTV